VKLDEQPVGVWQSGQPPLEVRANAGKHKLTVTADGRKDFAASHALAQDAHALCG
jgi:hypothetical protein